MVLDDFDLAFELSEFVHTQTGVDQVVVYLENTARGDLLRALIAFGSVKVRARKSVLLGSFGVRLLHQGNTTTQQTVLAQNGIET